MLNIRLFEKKDKDDLISKQKELLLREILNDIMHAKKELDIAQRNFDYANTPELIDIYSYQIITAQAKCDLLVKRAKESGLTFPRYLDDNVSLVNL